MRQTRLFLVVFVLALVPFMGGCGATEIIPTAPTPISGPGPEPVPGPTPGPAGLQVKLEISDMVTPSDRHTIESTIDLAQGYFATHLGREMKGVLTVAVSECSTAAHAVNGNRVVICTQSAGWRERTELGRRQMMSHELFHILQQQAGWPGSAGAPPSQWWILEGSAEFVGNAIATSQGGATYEQVRNCQATQYLFSGTVPPLDQLSSQANGSFSLGWLAWDRLLNGFGGIPKLSEFLSGASFDQVFGRSQGAFVAEFEQYRGAITRRGDGRTACSAFVN